MTGRAWRLALGALAAALAVAGPRAFAGDGPLVLAVHPFLPAAELQVRFAPLANYLGAALGRPMVVRVGRTYDEHVEFVGADRADIAFMGPAPYVDLVNRFGPKPLLARVEVKGLPYFRGAIVVRDDSPIRSVAELRGKRFAFGDRESTMSHLIPEYQLVSSGVPLDSLSGYEFVGDHRNVMLGVLSGLFDAGAAKEDLVDEELSKGLRVLAKTAPYSEHLFVARSTMPREMVEAARAALLRLKELPEGPAILHGVNQGATAFVPVSDRDYDNLRAVLRVHER